MSFENFKGYTTGNIAGGHIFNNTQFGDNGEDIMNIIKQQEDNELDMLVGGDMSLSNQVFATDMGFGYNNNITLSPDSNENSSIFAEDKEKKKQRNREAQKAFRDRKDAKLKELELKLRESEIHKQNLYTELENLKKLNTQLIFSNSAVSNGTSMATQSNNLDDVTSSSPQHNLKFTFPSEDEFFENIMKGRLDANLREKTLYKNDGDQQLLTVPATWEYLHSLTDFMELDITYVMERLKGHEMCHGFGAAYKKEVIDAIVEESIDKSG